ncbi:hypothetical protein V1520DRAFT_369314 [Lipomyces starkeyi]
MVYAEVVKKLQHHEEEGTEERCSCTITTRFLLPCSHQIVLGRPIDVTAIHPRWMVQLTLPTSAEKVQKAADRIEKVRRCKSCTKVGHNRRTCPKLKMDDTQEIERAADSNLRVSEDNEDFLLGDADDVAFEEMWADAMSALSR